MPQKKKYFSCFLGTKRFRKMKRTFLTPSRQPLNRFSWNLASLLSDSFPRNRCRRFLFSFFRFRCITSSLLTRRILNLNNSLGEDIVSDSRKRLTGIDGGKPDGRMEGNSHPYLCNYVREPHSANMTF